MSQSVYALFFSGMLLSASASASASASIANPNTVRIGYQKGGSLVLLKSSGELEKVLKNKGINVEWREFSVGPPLVEALNAGALDIGFVGAPPPVFAQAGAAPDLVYVGYGQPMGKGYGIVVKDSSTISSFEQLKSRKIGVAKGSAGELFLLQALEKYHLRREDVRVIYLGYSEGRAAWERGDIDAWAVPDPRFSEVELNSNGRAIITAADVPAQYNFYVSPTKFAHAYPAVLTTVLNTLNKTELKVSKDPAAAAKILSSDTRLPEAIWKKSLERQSWGVGWPLSHEVIESQQKVADLFYRYHMIPKAVQVQKIAVDLPVSLNQ